MKFYYLFFLFLFISCESDLCGTYEILERTNFEKKVINKNLKSREYLRKNVGTYTLILKKDSTFIVKDSNSVSKTIKGKWKIYNDNVILEYFKNGVFYKKDFIIDKNTLLNFNEVKLCENGKYINNVIFLTKTKNPE